MISSVAVGAAPASAAARAGSSRLACKRGEAGRAGAATSRGASQAVASSRDAARRSRLMGPPRRRWRSATVGIVPPHGGKTRSEEHTPELQSRGHLVCRLLLEKKKQLT